MYEISYEKSSLNSMKLLLPPLFLWIQWQSLFWLPLLKEEFQCIEIQTSWEHGSDIISASTPSCLPEASFSASLYPKISFPISFWMPHQPSSFSHYNPSSVCSSLGNFYHPRRHSSDRINIASNYKVISYVLIHTKITEKNISLW